VANTFIPKRYLKAWVLQRFCLAVAKQEYSTREQHEAWQRARLRRLLIQAERYVPFYRKRFRELGFCADDFRDMRDFQNLPCTTKRDIQDNGVGAFCDERIPDFLRLPANTGGSSGIPCPLLKYRPMTRLWEQAYIIQQWRRVGYDLGDRIAVLRGRAIDERNRIYDFNKSDNRLILSTYRLKKETVSEYVNVIRAFKVQFLHVYPASLALFLEYLRALYTRVRFPHLKGVLAGSEMLLPNQKELCEKILGVPCYHWYGHSEGTLLGGWCEKADKYHFFPQYGYLETLSDRESNDKSLGDIGELVGTGFCNPAMILIRYRTGDLGSGFRWERCGCGREFPTIDQIHGRMQDYLMTRDGCKIPMTAILYGLHLPIFEHYAKVQIEQRQPGSIKVKLENPQNISHTNAIEASKAAVEGALGGRMSVTFEEVTVIPPQANGKHQVVIQNLPM
jgi:phenylacetate-CoA ligase